MSFFSRSLDKLKTALQKTNDALTTDIRTLFIPGRGIDEAFLDNMEERLIRADMGVALVGQVVGDIRKQWKMGQIANQEQAGQVFRQRLLEGWEPDWRRELVFNPQGPTVIMVAGVNGAGKTTSIAKLCWMLKEQMGKSVMLAAGDTFRAAAVDQLTIWSERLGVEIVKHKMGADPAAVAYDACEAAKARGMDVLIVDTAGRLHTQDHLMRELTKIRDVVAKRVTGAPHEVLLVLDATTGQNGISQATNFGSAVNVSGVILAKLDGSAKGGMVFAIRDQLGIPVKFVGLGETPQDIETFNPERFVGALFGEASTAWAL